MIPIYAMYYDCRICILCLVPDVLVVQKSIVFIVK